MKARDIREFLDRPREPAQALKREHWAARAAADPLATLAAGHALYEHARAVQPDFPSAQYLADDLQHHFRLKALLDRAAQALAIRKASR